MVAAHGKLARGSAETEAQIERLAELEHARWMDELKEAPRWKPYADYAELASRLQKNNPRLPRDKAELIIRAAQDVVEGKLDGAIPAGSHQSRDGG